MVIVDEGDEGNPGTKEATSLPQPLGRLFAKMGMEGSSPELLHMPARVSGPTGWNKHAECVRAANHHCHITVARA